MSFRRVGRLGAMSLLLTICLACGEVYRPVVIPTTTNPPTPGNFHAVFGISTNVPNYPGEAMQIDVSGDTVIGETTTSTASSPNNGLNPTHAATSANKFLVFVATAGSVFSGGVDSVSSFTPMQQSTIATGLGAVNVIALPSQTSNIAAISESGSLVTVTLATPLSNTVAGYSIAITGVSIPGCTPTLCNAYNGTFTLSSISGTTIQYVNPVAGLAAGSGGTASVPPQPVFLNTTQNTAMYVANYNSNSVAAINTTSNVVTNSAVVGAHPVSLAEMPNGLKLYVANEGSNTISSLNSVDLSQNAVSGFTGVAPVWVVARGDNQKMYVVTQGDGQLVTIDTATDTVTSSLPVGGAGANYVFFDPNLNRLYVTNPQAGMVYVFSDTGGANDTPVQLAQISFGSSSAPCPLGCLPVSVTALPDGSRFYVASYQVAAVCPDLTVTGACVIPGVTVFDANSMTPKSTPAMQLLTWPPFATNQYAVPQVASCNPPTPPALYSPTATRFRVFTAAAPDSSRVYVSMCDAGAIAVINTTNSNANNPGGNLPADTVTIDLLAAFSAGPAQGNGEPAPQNPIFLLTGQ